MKKNFTLIFTILLCLFWSKGEAQTQFWSDTFEDSGAPSSGTRTPSTDTGFPSVPYAYYFMRTDGTNLNLQAPFSGDPFTTYQNVQGTKFWAGEDTDRARTGITDTNDKIQNITWTGINISGKSGLTFKGLFAAHRNQAWQNPTFGATYDFLIVEYSIDGGAWTRVGGFNGDTSSTNAGYLSEDTDGDNYGDGTQLSKTFQEFNWNISGTGTTLSLRFRVSADGSAAQEFAIDNFRLFEASSCTNPTISSNPPNRTICNGNNTTFSITATGATVYQWQVNTGSGFTDITNGGVYSNATTSTLTITGATSIMNGYLYRCVAKDGSCSTTSNSGTLTVSAISTSAGSQSNVSCLGGSNGVAAVSPSGGVSPYSYSWLPSGGTSSIATGLSAGSYTVTVTDDIGCTATRTFTITQPPALSLTASSQTNIACNGGATGAASVNVATGGAGGYTYNWTPGNPTGDGTTSVSGLTAGTWTCTVTDANACTVSVNFTVTQPPALSLTASSQTNIACNGGATGAASVNVATGGAGGYTYNWTPGNPTGDGTTSVSGLTAGTWTCTVTDANACTASVNFTVTQPPALSLTGSSQTNIACNGGATGAASVNVATGGAGGYTYNWTPGNPTGDGTPSVSGLTAGTWTCTVTDANACTASVNFTVTQPPALALTASSQTNIACNGGATGAASVNVATGGAGGYTYNWTPGNPTGDGTTSVSGLTAGTWTCTVTDANACTASVNFTVTQPTALGLTASSQTNISCYGGSNGAASVNVATGGAGGYTYNWTPGNPTGDGTPSVSGLTAGTWTCTVTDANACTASVNFTVTQPPALALTASSQTNIACNGGATGAASVNVATGGAGGYTYNWTPGNPTGDGTPSVTGLTAGTWTCTVTDANACTASQSFTVTQPTALVATVGSQTNVSCNGGSNGSATVSPTGGTPGYTYSWSPSGGTAATATGLAAGTYTVTVTDANNCQATQSFTITEPTALVASASSQTNVSCNGGTNGSATVAASGGTSSYTYSWSPSGGTAATASGLAAGTYTVTVTDANNCQATQSFTITQPTALIATTAKTDVLCNGGTTGTATILVSGGTGAYSYLWSPSGGTAATATGLAAGNYSVLVTDANGCNLTRSFTITEPTALVASAALQTNVSCNGGMNGSATVSPTGGTPGYIYSWSPSGGTAATATGLAAGNYTVTVTDANNCQATQSFTITEPTALSFTTTSLAGYDYNTLYSQSVNVTGGTGSKTFDISSGSLPSGFNLSPSGIISGTSTQVADSNFTVSATDVNGCVVTQNFILKLNQIPITVTADVSQTKVYGAPDPIFTYTVTPALLSGDSFTGALTRVSGENIGSYVINQGTLSAGDQYLITYVSKDFSITAKPITVTAAAKNKTYGDVDPALTYTFAPALVTGDSFSGSLTRSAGENVGTYAINQGTLALSSNYTLTYVGADLTIAKKAITVTAAAKNKTYGDADPALTYTFAPALVTGDSFTGNLTRSAGEDVGTYAVNQGTLALSNNYTLTYVGADLTIAKKAITVTAAAKNKTYGDADPALTYTFAPALVTGDSFTGSLTRSAGENVGTYAINQGTLALSNNYTLTYVGADLTIAKKAITVTAAAKNKTYGDADPALTYTFTPALVTGDSFTGSLTRSAGENVGTYAINQGTLALSNNYTLTYVGADLTIAKKAITVTAAAKNKTYGDADPALTYTFAPALVSGDNFSGSLSRTTGENVGTYAINQGTLALSNNYMLTYVGADLTIAKKAITVTAAAKNKTYGDVDPALTYTFAPALVTGDSFSGSLTRSAGENVGTYAINQGTLALSSNYTLTYVGADLTIAKKAITVTAAAKNKTYGDVDPVLTYTFAPALVTGDSFTGSLTRSAGENVGTYAINQGTLALSSNYTLTYVGADLTIAKKAITVTAAAKNKTYGDADPALTYTFAPALVTGDSFSGNLTRSAGEDVGAYAINQGTLALSSNYTLTYVGADLTIAKKAITVTAAAKNKTYGDADPALTYTFAPALVTGDSFTGNLTRSAGEDVGAYTINQGTLALSNNYTLTYVGADLTIAKKAITVTAAAKNKTYGDADPALTYTFAPALVTGDSFSGNLTRSAGENVGTYAINQGTLALSNNYTLTYVGADLTITKADQIITWNQTLELGCDGETSLILTAVSNSGLAVNYTSSNTNVATISNGVVNFQNYGSATITASQEGNINYNAAPEVVLPIINSQPNLIRKQFEDVIFFDNSSKNFTSYSWYKNGVLVPGQTNQYFKENGALNGTYYAVATKSDGTLITTCSLTLSPTVEEEYIKIAPNPVRSNGSFQLINNVSSNRLQNARIELYNITGNVLINMNTNQNTVDLKAPTVEGIYIVKMTLTNGKYFTKNLLVKN